MPFSARRAGGEVFGTRLRAEGEWRRPKTYIATWGRPFDAKLISLLLSQPNTVEIWSHLNDYYLFFGTAAGVIVITYLMVSVVRNRAREGRPPPKFEREEGWGKWQLAILPLLLTGAVLGFVEYETFASVQVYIPPQSTNTIHIGVIAQQWSWTFVYPNGVKVVGNLTVPANQEVVLNITSIDVAHSLFIPSLDVGRDAIPGHYNTLWFEATSPHVYLNGIRCRELCGVGHAFMLADLTVVSQSAYQQWYSTLGGK